MMVRLPWTRAWIQNQAVRGYNFLDEVKDDVPDELKGLWRDAYATLDAVIDAFADDRLTVREIRSILRPGLSMINELRSAVR